MTNMNLYDFNLIEKRKHQSKLCWILLVVSFVIIVGILIIIAMFVNDSNSLILQIISTILFVIYGWFALYFIFNVLVNNYRLINFLSSLKRAVPQSCEFEILGFGKELTLSRSIETIEIKVKNSEEEKIIYWDKTLGSLPFEIAKKYNFTTANNFIVRYEETSND